jgi:hypothetical protein
VWWVPVVVLGLATMVVGGWRAMAQYDLKRLLAFGTVSQLGFLMVLFGAGTRIAAIAGITMLLAHGFFKAPLFLVTGIVDHATGTRDVRKLSGLWTSLRGSAVTAGAAAASMAGLPPLLGFVGKEAGFEAFLAEDDLRGRLVTLALVAGSIFTVAYSARFLWGAFGRKPGVADTPVHRPGPLLSWPAGLCALGGLVLGIANPVVDVDAQSYAAAYPVTFPAEAGYHLALWHGLGLPLPGVRRRARARLRTAPVVEHGRAARRIPAARAVGAARLRTRRRRHRACRDGRHRPAAGGLGPDLPHRHPRHRRRPARHGRAGRRLVAGPARLPRAAAAAAGPAGDARGARPGVGAPPVHRGAAGRGGRLRRRRPVHRRRCPRSRAGPVPRRDPVTGRVRVRPPPDARPVHPGAAAGPGPGAQSRDRGRRGRDGRRDGGRAQRRPPGTATTSAEFIRLAPEGAGATNVISAIIVDFRALDTVGEITVLFVAAVGGREPRPRDALRPQAQAAAGAAPEARSTRRRSPARTRRRSRSRCRRRRVRQRIDRPARGWPRGGSPPGRRNRRVRP